MILDLSEFLTEYPNISKPDFNYNIFNKKEFYDEKSGYGASKDEGELLLRHQKIVQRFLSPYTNYKGLLLFHAMGTGKSCSSIGIAENLLEKGSYKRVLVIVSNKSLSLNFKRELLYKCSKEGKYPKPPGSNSREISKAVKKNTKYKFFTRYSFQSKKAEEKQLFTIKKKKVLTPAQRDRVVKMALNKAKLYSNSVIILDEVHNINPKYKYSGNKSKLIPSNTAGEATYLFYFIFLHFVKNSKILLLSGTPMTDSADDIVPILNLILPLKKSVAEIKDVKNVAAAINQMSYLKMNELFERCSASKHLKLREDSVEYFRNSLKGLVSYVGTGDSIIDYIKESPSKNNDLYDKYLNSEIISHTPSLSVSLMCKRQTNCYLYNKQETNNKKSSFDENLQQISLFLYPDGTFGSNWTTYFKESKNKWVPNKMFRQQIQTCIKSAEYDDMEEWKKQNMGGKWTAESAKYAARLRKLYECFSCKYALSIKQVLDSINNKQIGLIYSRFVKGSGLYVFKNLLLKCFDFSESNGNVRENTKTLSMVSSDNSDSVNDSIKSWFNKKNNKNGNVTNCLLFSDIAKEGYSFKNVRYMDILTPYWNFSKLSQVIARGTRFGSHADLGENIKVRVYLRVAIPDSNSNIICKGCETTKNCPTSDIEELNNFSSVIDLKLYYISFSKDKYIKQVERILKEESFDCALNYKRNKASRDFSRDCDYKECSYECSGIDGKPGVTKKSDEYLLDSEYIQKDNYNILYNTKNIENVSQKIKKLFSKKYITKLSEIKKEIKENNFAINEALYNIIFGKQIIKSPMNLNCFLSFSNDVFYLSTAFGNSLSYKTYIENPIVNYDTNCQNKMDGCVSALAGNMIECNSVMNYCVKACTQCLNPYSSQTDKDIYFAKTVFSGNIKNRDDLCNLLNYVKPSSFIQELLLEKAYVSESEKSQKNKDIRKIILQHYSAVISTTTKKIVSPLILENNKKLWIWDEKKLAWEIKNSKLPLRIFDENNKIWKNATEELTNSYINKDIVNTVNKLGIYATVNPENCSTCLVDYPLNIKSKNLKPIKGVFYKGSQVNSIEPIFDYPNEYKYNILVNDEQKIVAKDDIQITSDIDSRKIKTGKSIYSYGNSQMKDFLVKRLGQEIEDKTSKTDLKKMINTKLENLKMIILDKNCGEAAKVGKKITK
jgi:hypothetical protein